jgi:hypothetical protein
VSEITLAQTEGVCFCCGKKGYLSNICRYRNKPKAEWHVYNAKEIQHVMQQANSPSTTISNTPPPSSETSSAETKGNKNSIFEWEEKHVQLACIDFEEVAGMAMSQRQSSNCKEWILLDNQSTCHYFCNPDLVSTIRNSNKILLLQTNGGTAATSQVADIPQFGETWYNPDGMTNILSLSLVKKIHKVTYDGENGVFMVHIGEKIMSFRESPEGPHYYRPNIINHTSMLQTVEDNKAFYTSRQVDRAKKARDL